MSDVRADDGHRGLLDELVERLKGLPVATPSLFVNVEGGAAMLGLSRSAFYRLHGTNGFPAPVDLPGTGPHWRRADLEKWAAKLKPRRRKAEVIEVEA